MALVRSPISSGPESWSRDRRCRGSPLRGELVGPRPGLETGDGLGDRLDVRRRGAAAAADEAGAELLGEAAVRLGQLGRGEVIDGPAVDVLRQAGVGLDRDHARAGAPEVTHVLDHEVGAGGAVEADDVDRQRLEDDQRGRRVGADEQGAGGLDGDLHEHGDLDAPLARDPVDRQHRALDLQDVLAGLDEDAVGAAVDEALGLAHDAGQQVVEAHVAERDQAGAGADRAEHEARPLGGRVLARDLLGDLGGAPVQRVTLAREVELGQHVRHAAEGVGLDAVGPGLEVGGVDVPDDVGPRAHQDLGAAVVTPVVVGGQGARLDHGAHGPVAHEHALLHGPQQRQGAPARGQIEARDRDGNVIARRHGSGLGSKAARPLQTSSGPEVERKAD
ncbi:hypothetical protein OV079_35200 [Nannocystis pusilla]|uniref:Uncharacterized protein n=1 Tax=Nannocystis pusilla TaxID=889268 RepID=A0A9X3J248_9BACT|nr:hypothetical protein [Nannocystis pusilla]MCY1010723.1 hypothetical protein [Nannocystis pusilla]